MITEKKSSVLVIGGGFAGMYAALAASEAGAAVTVLCKGRVGSSGNSTIAMSVHRFAPDAPGLREEYRERFLRSAAGIPDAETGEYFVNYAAAAMEKLRSYGLPLHFRTKTEAGEEHPYLACCDPKRGIILTRALRSYLEEHTAVRMVENTMAADLLTVNGAVCGVLALRDGELVSYPADAVVLACGGAGHIYADTNNTADITGDGYAMALRVGLPLRDMEFVQFYPYRIVSPGVADIFPDIFDHGAVYRNGRGERFMEKPEYPRREQENRDIVARAMYDEGEVWLDLSACEPEYLQKECPNIAEMYRTHPGEKLIVRPMAHFFMGGIPLRPDCSAELRGLYVCGEVTGGLHGANRLAGSALTECVLFGSRAGKEAAAYAGKTSAPDCENAAGTLAAEYPAPGEDDLKALRRRLGETMAKNVSLIRNEKGLSEAQAELSEIEKEFSAVHPDNLKAWLELRNMLLTAKVVTDAAMKRKESVGAHCRREGEDREK